MEKAQATIRQLNADYEELKKNGSLKKYKEAQTRKNFILPLFEALGWNVYSDEVVEEDTIVGKRVDYGFYLNGVAKFYLEAKPLSADIHKEEYAEQAIKYAWNKGVTWAVLSDFENIIVFNALSPEKSLHGKKYFEIPYSEYLSRFDQLWLLSKESFTQNLLDREAEKHGKKLTKISVTETLAKDLNECRRLLTEAFLQWNRTINPALIDEGVQRLLDRLIFIRVAEDRGIEPPTLRPMVNEWLASGREKYLYQLMTGKFRELDAIYNSNLFIEHAFEKWEEHHDATKDVIEILYGNKNYVQYDFSVIPADVLGSVYESYLGYKLQKSKQQKLIGEDLELGKDARKRKEQGIYYTPKLVVDYIVKNALGPVLARCRSMQELQNIKVLDPACGSGSFLVAAFNFLLKEYEKAGKDPKNPYVRASILERNIYGVDLDQQAVEIARLNLLLNVFDYQIKLPDLGNNIKCGNSLISGTDEELEKQFGRNWRDKKPFNWKEEFPGVFKQGGFDVIIGNPPYLKELDNKEIFQEIRKSNFAKYFQGKMDFWYFFLHRSIELAKENGTVAFITNSYFLKSAGATKLIEHLKSEMILSLAVDFQDIPVFADVSGRHLIHIWQKKKDKSGAITKYIKLDKDSFSGIIDENKLIELPYAEVIKDSSIGFEMSTQTNATNVVLLGNIYDVSQGVVEATDKISKKAAVVSTDQDFKPGEGVFVLSENELKTLALTQNERPLVKKYLNTNNVKRYYISFEGEYLIYSDKKAKSKIVGGAYPHIKSHLDKMKQFITSSNAPYGLHRPRESKYFENPKLICKGMFLTPEFCIDDEKYYVGFSFSVIIQKDKNYDLKYLLGLLNSGFARRWFDSNGKKRGVGVDIGVAVFRKFPIYKANKTEQKRIGALVDKMLKLQKELREATEHSEKWERIKGDIEKTDRKIDAEVYRLYGLTEEEIKVVEG